MNRLAVSKMLRKIDAAHNRINSGGCACMAVMIAEHLEDMVQDMRIVSPCHENIDDVRSNLEENGFDTDLKANWYDEGVWFSHVWVEGLVDGEWYAFDSTGVQEVQDMYDRWGRAGDGSFTIEEMRSMSNEQSWNSLFDRSQLDSMQLMVNRGFQHLAE